MIASTILLDSGGEGAPLTKIIEEAKMRYDKQWANAHAAKTTLITAMTADDHDNVFCRIGPGHYGLRHLVPPEVLAANRDHEYMRNVNAPTRHKKRKSGEGATSGGGKQKKTKSDGKDDGSQPTGAQDIRTFMVIETDEALRELASLGL